MYFHHHYLPLCELGLGCIDFNSDYKKPWQLNSVLLFILSILYVNERYFTFLT